MIKSFDFKPKVVIRLAQKSEHTLKRLEEKLSNFKKFNQLFSKGSKVYCKPDKLLISDSNRVREKKNTTNIFVSEAW
jgi:hypothetical protein